MHDPGPPTKFFNTKTRSIEKGNEDIINGVCIMFLLLGYLVTFVE
jgi:hypothetical protein